MATVSPQSRADLTEEERKRLEAGTDDIATPTTAAPMAQTKTATTAAVTPLTDERGSGSFQNLNKFIEANKGKSEQFAGGVAGGLESKLSGELGKVKTGVQEKIGQIESGRQTTSTLPSDVFTKGSQGWQNIKNILSGPTYSGPTGLTQDTEALKNIGQTVAGTSTPGGLGNVLSETYKEKGVPTVTAGESRFDKFLLQRDPAAQAKLAALRESAPGILQQGETEVAKLGATEASVRAANITNQATIKKQLETEQARINQAIEADRLAKQDAQRNAILKALDTGGGIKMDVRDDIGFQGGIENLLREYERAGYNPRESLPSLNIAREQVITPEQAAQLNALAELSGQAGTYTAGGYAGPNVQPLYSSLIDPRVGRSIGNLIPQVGSPLTAATDEIAMGPTEGQAIIPEQRPRDLTAAPLPQMQAANDQQASLAPTSSAGGSPQSDQVFQIANDATRGQQYEQLLQTLRGLRA